jgi:hypothetical protein
VQFPLYIKIKHPLDVIEYFATKYYMHHKLSIFRLKAFNFLLFLIDCQGLASF